jgi:hypothetical protein
MDMQILFNIFVGVIGALGGWILNTIWGEIKSMQETDDILADKVAKIEVLVAGQYCKRDEMERLSVAIFAKLDRIEDKLDGKADK